MTCVFVCVKLIKQWYLSGSVLTGRGSGGWGVDFFNQLTQGRKHAGQ